MSKLSVTSYRARVLEHLLVLGLSRESATTHLRGAAEAIRVGSSLGVQPEMVASGIIDPSRVKPLRAVRPSSRARAGLTSGTNSSRRGHAAGHAVGHASGGCGIPVEAFMLGPGEFELPPLPPCRVAHGTGAGDGFATGTGVRFDATKQARMLREFFGPLDLQSHDLENAYSGRTRAGVAAIAKVVSVGRPDIYSGGGRGVEAIKVRFEIRIDKFVGEMIRAFFRDKSGAFRVHHEMFNLNASMPQSTGTGVGESVTRNAIRALMSWKFSRISTHAVWVGRYVWASFGWNWDHAMAGSMHEALVTYVRTRRSMFSAHGIRGRSLEGAFEFDDLRQFSAGTRALCQHSWNVASLEILGADGRELIRVGQNFLAGIRRANDKGENVPLLTEQGAENWDGELLLKPGNPGFERARVRLKL